MNDQMKEKEQAVLRWMKHLGDEFEYIATSPLQEKYKLSLIMIYIDIFSNVWSKFTEHRQQHRFIRWSENFIFSEQNKFYMKYREEFEFLDSRSLYDLRCSLLHFGALRIKSQSSMPIFISSLTRREFTRNYSHQIKEQPMSFLVLCPKVISLAVIGAICLTLDSLAELEKSNRDVYAKGILKLFKEVQAVALPLQIPSQKEH